MNQLSGLVTETRIINYVNSDVNISPTAKYKVEFNLDSTSKGLEGIQRYYVWSGIFQQIKLTKVQPELFLACHKFLCPLDHY